MRSRWLVLIAGGIAALIAATLVVPRSSGDDRSEVFCGLYPQIEKMVAMLERGLEGRPQPGDLPPDNYRSLQALVWSDQNAASGPDDLDDDAVLVATAVRKAARDEDPAPLQTDEARQALARLGPAARQACDLPDG